MAQGPLQKITADKLALHARFFKDVVERIECTVPKGSDYITTQQEESGIVIKIDINKLKQDLGTSTGSVGGCPYIKLMELDVCKNGEPGTIYVLGIETEGQAELCADLFGSISPS